MSHISFVLCVVCCGWVLGFLENQIENERSILSFIFYIVHIHWQSFRLNSVYRLSYVFNAIYC